jgi:3',5'-cyclic AMP phosphodiesterase CpdA
VIGDVHGDSWSLAAALRLAAEPSWLADLGVLPAGSTPAVVMLGDLVDRGADHVECILLAAKRMASAPRLTVWISGNHDVGHRWVDSESAFVSELSPAEITDWLNGGPVNARSARVAFGKAFFSYVHRLPRAVAFRSGILAIHGGVPHCDIFHTFDSLASLQASDAAKDDFTWIRIAERAPVKYPNRSRRGCELGTEQMVACVAHISTLLEREGYARIQAVVRGHDHYGDRYFIHAAGFPPMSLVTVNTMGVSDDSGNPFITGDFSPCIAVYVPGRMPRIVKIRLPESDRAHGHDVRAETAPEGQKRSGAEDMTSDGDRDGHSSVKQVSRDSSGGPPVRPLSRNLCGLTG